MTKLFIFFDWVDVAAESIVSRTLIQRLACCLGDLRYYFIILKGKFALKHTIRVAGK